MVTGNRRRVALEVKIQLTTINRIELGTSPET